MLLVSLPCCCHVVFALLECPVALIIGLAVPLLVPPWVATATVIIGEPEELTIQVDGTDVSCGGECDGTALVTPSGGTGPYSYDWSDPGIPDVPDPSGLRWDLHCHSN